MEYNLRERAEIVYLAQQASQSLKAQDLIDYFEKKHCKNTPKAKKDLETQTLITRVLEQFQDSYFALYDEKYVITARGKERAAIDNLIKLQEEFDKDTPVKRDPNELVRLFRNLFDKALRIEDTWLRENMSPSILYTNINKVKKIIKYGKQKSVTSGATPEQIDAIIKKHSQG